MNKRSKKKEIIMKPLHIIHSYADGLGVGSTLNCCSGSFSPGGGLICIPPTLNATLAN